MKSVLKIDFESNDFQNQFTQKNYLEKFQKSNYIFRLI